MTVFAPTDPTPPMTRATAGMSTADWRGLQSNWAEPSEATRELVASRAKRRFEVGDVTIGVDWDQCPIIDPARSFPCENKF